MKQSQIKSRKTPSSTNPSLRNEKTTLKEWLGVSLMKESVAANVNV